MFSVNGENGFRKVDNSDSSFLIYLLVAITNIPGAMLKESLLLFLLVLPAECLRLNLQEIANQPLTLRLGRVPSWLNGTWYINGPSVHNFTEYGVDKVTDHFFDGLGAIAAFEFSNRNINLSTKYVESETFLRLKDHGQYDSMTFGSAMDWNSVLRYPFSILFDNTPINLYQGRNSSILYATSDSTFVHGIDTKSLNTVSSSGMDSLGFLGAAHPAVDPGTGMAYNYAGPMRVSLDVRSLELVGLYALTEETHHENGTFTKRVMGEVWVPALWLVHSVALTADFVVYRVLSERPRATLNYGSLANFLRFEKSKHVEMIVVNRQTDETLRVTCDESFSSFHIINSYQIDDGTIVIDQVASSESLLNERSADAFSHGYKPGQHDDHVIAEDVPYFYKRCIVQIPSTQRMFNIDAESLNSNTCHCNDLFRWPFELPCVNPLFKQKRHRFVWSASATGKSLWVNRIVKFDLNRIDQLASHITMWVLPVGYIVGEPRMIPNPSQSAEDDGVVLVVITHVQLSETQLAILDAASLELLSFSNSPIDFSLQVHGVYMDKNFDNYVSPN